MTGEGDRNTPSGPPEEVPAEGHSMLSMRGLRELLLNAGGGGGMRAVIARGAIHSMVINVGGAAISMGVQILLARTLGVASFGAYLLVLAWMNVALVPGKLEMDNCAVRFVGAYHANAEWGLLRGFLPMARRIVLRSSLAVGFVAAIVLLVAGGRIEAEVRTAGLVACVLLPTTALLLLNQATLQGLKHYVAAQVPNAVIRPLCFGLGVVMLRLLLPHGLTASEAVAVNLCATAIALGLTFRWWRQFQPAETRNAVPQYDLKEWWRTSRGLVAVAVSQLVISMQSDVLVVGTLLQKSDAGLYGAAGQLASLLVFGANSVSFVVQPIIANLWASGRHRDLQRVLRDVARANLLLAMPLFLGLVLFGSFVLSLYGDAFRIAYPLLVLLALSQLTAGVIGSTSGYLLTMTGHQHHAGVIIGASAALNLLLTLILTPLFGPMGTAVATLIATLTRSVVLAVYIWRVMRLNVLPR